MTSSVFSEGWGLARALQVAAAGTIVKAWYSLKEDRP
jgi:hypothetical protein